MPNQKIENWERVKKEFSIAIKECRTLDWYLEKWIPKVEELLKSEKERLLGEIKRAFRTVGHQDDWGIQVIYLNMLLKELRDPKWYERAEKKRKEKLKKEN